MSTPFKVILSLIVLMVGLVVYVGFKDSGGGVATSETTASVKVSNNSVDDSGSSYPTLESFIRRWNVQPKIHVADDQQAMAISQPWAACDDLNDQSCMTVQVCGGHGFIRAIRAVPTNSYTYIFVINAGNVNDPNSSLQCTTGLQRLFNALYNDPAVAQEAIASFMGLRDSVTSENYAETYQNALYDMRWAKLNNAFIKTAMPSTGGDSTVDELRDFWSHSVDIASLSETNTRNMQP